MLARVSKGRCGIGHAEAELLHGIYDARARSIESLVPGHVAIWFK